MMSSEVTGSAVSCILELQERCTLGTMLDPAYKNHQHGLGACHSLETEVKTL
ncbi:hypothetical protein I79_009289 [Cricetulus griseus]|uniref:Uncharacterized protein n=1 Tax=Cricetulus griseus TaxID=10029 RepID=G3HFD3_CRIGR|nr:hypothetical protein I79_009289 [Cricetulus griseus]